ncbi:MAG: SWIM zinc finger family protein [Chloroflexota bacterium]
MKPKDVKRLQRLARGLRVRPIAKDMLVVESKSSASGHHIVTIHYDENGTLRCRCSCAWAAHGGYGCSHVMAALAYLAEKRRRAISFWPTREDAERQRNRMLRLVGSQSDDENGLWITTRPLRQPA